MKLEVILAASPVLIAIIGILGTYLTVRYYIYVQVSKKLTEGLSGLVFPNMKIHEIYGWLAFMVVVVSIASCLYLGITHSRELKHKEIMENKDELSKEIRDDIIKSLQH